ncbi:gamma-tubulin complex component [Caerostris extrusa]|uniref:Gamma-tubulin complex component n=1 Tax=Caerostris extrusa TaxID=172846 RepID=A0AAV4RYW8_CAEEX|nr:gamma-tubulin complex component [Caerostris extrusa]
MRELRFSFMIWFDKTESEKEEGFKILSLILNLWNSSNESDECHKPSIPSISESSEESWSFDWSAYLHEDDINYNSYSDVSSELSQSDQNSENESPSNEDSLDGLPDPLLRPPTRDDSAWASAQIAKTVLHERNVIKEILWMMCGVKDLFVAHWDGRKYIPYSQIHFTNLTSNSVYLVLNEFCSYATKMTLLQDFLYKTVLDVSQICHTYEAYVQSLLEIFTENSGFN